MGKTKIITCFADSISEFKILRTGSSKIDKILKGGFKTNILNEIVGSAGSGKTQLCMYLTLMVQLPERLGGLSKAAVYICTEDVFPIKRLYELGSHFQEKFGIENVLDNIFISHVADLEKLKKLLCTDIKHLAKFKNIGIIIIDSIAGLFRSDNSGVNYTERSNYLAQIAAELRKLGSKLHCVIICCNQMTDNLSTGFSEPCLGLSWSNLINSRFLLTKLNSPTRKFEVIYSPDLSCSTSYFSISSMGIS